MGKEMQGVLPSQEIRELIKKGYITSEAKIADPGSASLDLSLGSEVYRLNSSSLLRDQDLLRNVSFKWDIEKAPVLLEPNVTYLIPVRERFKLPQGLRGYSNPKSTSGRLDASVRLIGVRLIGKGSNRYDSLEEGFDGGLFLEIKPQLFPLVIKRPGISLNQIRFFSGDSDMNENAIRVAHSLYPLVFNNDGNPLDDKELRIHSLGTGKPGIIFTLNLREGNEKRIVGYKAKNYPLDLLN